MIAVMTAYKEGKTIQWINKANAAMDWEDCPNPCWDWACLDYRVKPGLKLRPYANAKEFVEAMCKHGPFITMGDEIYTMPLRVCNDEIESWGNESTWDSYENLTDWYKWQDGTPCGIEEGGDQ